MTRVGPRRSWLVFWLWFERAMVLANLVALAWNLWLDRRYWVVFSIACLMATVWAAVATRRSLNFWDEQNGSPDEGKR